jgi:HAD superfamily hydrolase (TIGR01450 family)
MDLADVRGFVFDVDGTLVRRFPDGVHPLPGAVEVLERIRASGRPLAIFSNGSHMPPEEFARHLRDDGLPVADEEMVTPMRSALSYLRRRHAGAPVLLFAQPSVAERLAREGVDVIVTGESDGGRGPGARPPGAVLVLHIDDTSIPDLEQAARAVTGGAKLLTANYLPAYAGANGPIFSRGAMVTAAIAKAADVRPTVVGKPSRAAVQEVSTRLGVPSADLLVTGDDVRMDVGLGHLGGSRTVLVRSGITGGMDLSRLPAHRRPHAVIDGVEELLAWL